MDKLAETLSSNPNLTIFNGLIDALAPGWRERAELNEMVRTVIAGSDAGYIALAQSLGFGGSDAAGAQAHLLATLPPQTLLDIINVGFSSQYFKSNALPESIGGTGPHTLGSADYLLTDGDADTPDAQIIQGDIKVRPFQGEDRYLHVTDHVMLPYEIAGNDGFVQPPLPGLPFAGDDFAQILFLDDVAVIYDARGGDDIIYSGRGDDTLLGGKGDDILVAGSGNDIVSGGNGDDWVTGSGGDDFVQGQNGHDTVRGGGGNDELRGGDGDDLLEGQNGNDILKGDRGNDILLGGEGDDWLNEAVGDGTLDGGAGNDWMKGGDGLDTFVFATGSGRDTIARFEDGLDTLDVSGYGFADFGEITVAQSGADTLIGLSETDSILLLGIDATSIDATDFVFV